MRERTGLSSCTEIIPAFLGSFFLLPDELRPRNSACLLLLLLLNIHEKLNVPGNQLGINPALFLCISHGNTPFG